MRPKILELDEALRLHVLHGAWQCPADGVRNGPQVKRKSLLVLVVNLFNCRFPFVLIVVKLVANLLKDLLAMLIRNILD